MWLDVQQNTEEWHELRCGKVTSSNASFFMANEGKAFGDTAKRYALQIALERINGCKSDNGFVAGNTHTERGHKQEPIARMLYEEMNFVDVTHGGFYDHEKYGDSPDGLVNHDGVVEIKSVIAPVHYATLTRRSFDPSYTWQLISHLECSGRDWVDFISYCSEFPEHNQILVYRLNRIDYINHIDRLIIRRNEFLDLIRQIENQIKL